MKKLRFLAAFLAILLAATPVLAQSTPTTSRARLKPFTSENMIAKVDYAEAIRKCDRRILNVDCDQLVEVANRRFNLGLDLNQMSAGAARNAVADFIMNTIEVQCAQSRSTTLAAAMPNGDIRENGVNRTMQQNERCLYDSNLGMWVASLMCGNFITDDNLAGVFPAEERRRLTDQFNDAARQASNQTDQNDSGSGARGNGDSNHEAGKSNWYDWLHPKRTGGKVAISVGVGVVFCALIGACSVNKNSAKAEAIINR